MDTTFNLAVPMRAFHCVKCGIPFAAPEGLITDRTRAADAEDDESDAIYCPSGHPNWFQWNKPKPDQRTEEAKRRLLQLTHEIEQAEAQLTERRRDLALTAMPASEVAAPARKRGRPRKTPSPRPGEEASR